MMETATESPEAADILLDPITDDVREMLQLINYSILCGIISFIGIGANIVNIAVFVTQGFKDTINISLLGLAVADLACSITMLWTSYCHSPLFLNLDLPIEPLHVMYVTGGWPHECFNRITSLITAFITLERCLCIAMPLRVKTLITPFRTKVISVSIFMSMFLVFSPFYFVNKLDWVYSNSRNKSVLSLTFTKDKELVDSVTFFIHSVFLSTALLLSVAICTIILIIKLNKKSKWRKAAVAEPVSKSELIAIKNKKVIKMITLISSIYIACYIQPTILFLVMLLYPEYNYTARFHNLLIVTWSLAYVLEAINSSVNIFVYFSMSTKFRDTLCGLLPSTIINTQTDHKSVYSEG